MGAVIARLAPWVLGILSGMQVKDAYDGITNEGATNYTKRKWWVLPLIGLCAVLALWLIFKKKGKWKL